MGWGIVAVLLLGLYFVPAFIAAARKHKSATAILVLNLLLGWTLLGWVLAIVWAFTGNVTTTPPASADLVRCPECMELILKGARKCKHCGTQLVGVAAPAGMRPCPDCQRLAPESEEYCPSCGHNMAAG